jgi:hypothetical protein
MADNPIGIYEWFCLSNRANSVSIFEINEYSRNTGLYSTWNCNRFFYPKIHWQKKVQKRL